MLRLHARTNHRITEKQREDSEEENKLSASKDSTSEVSAENNLTSAKTYIKKRIQCDHCDKKFNKQERFKLHMETVHKGSKRDECDNCDKTYNSKNALREHKKTVHVQLATYGGSNKESNTNNSTVSTKSIEVTSQYHLRSRVPEKQYQMSKSLQYE